MAKELSQIIIAVMEIAQSRDEVALQHFKLIHRRMDLLTELFIAKGNLADLPDSEEKQAIVAALNRIPEMLDKIAISVASLVARHETDHEHQQHSLAIMRENLLGETTGD